MPATSRQPDTLPFDESGRELQLINGNFNGGHGLDIWDFNFIAADNSSLNQTTTVVT